MDQFVDEKTLREMCIIYNVPGVKIKTREENIRDYLNMIYNNIAKNQI